MADSVTMTGFSEDKDSGQVEVAFTWRGEPYEARFENKARMIELATDSLQSPSEAARALLSFWLVNDPTAATPPVTSNNKLSLDYAAAAMQLTRSTVVAEAPII